MVRQRENVARQQHQYQQQQQWQQQLRMRRVLIESLTDHISAKAKTNSRSTHTQMYKHIYTRIYIAYATSIWLSADSQKAAGNGRKRPHTRRQLTCLGNCQQQQIVLQMPHENGAS